MTSVIKNLELPFGVTLPTVSSLHIVFNDHKTTYETIDDWMGSRDFWVSEEEHQKAVAQDTIWVAHWYPHTPIGSYTVAASSLEAVLKALQEIKL